MRTGFLHSSRYSPGTMDRQALETLFVGRSDLMEDVLSRTTKSILGTGKHYVLLVGPRGSGKTHFLTLAYHRLMDRLRADNALSRVAVALLKEEEWGVASFLDFVVRILRALADQAPELEAALAVVYDRFPKDPVEAEAFAVAQLRRYTRGKTLLVLCENLVDLFDGLGMEGQKRWRSAIQEDANWSIVASTPSLFSAVTLQHNPFYGFFAVRSLERIDFDASLDLLVKKAVHEGKTELAEFLRTPLGRARARAIHHLAAGNHRAYVVLFDFLDRETLDDLVHPFMRMVDDLTPYYQERIRQLAPAQRKIVEFLCLEARPRTIKDISTPCLMSQQTAAKQIGELDAAGFVNRRRVGRNTYCELSEPLMRICIEVKDNRTGHFRLFVELLRHWFTNRELERRQAAFQRKDRSHELDRIHVEEAVRCSLAERHEPLVDALEAEALRCWEAGDCRGLATIQEALVRAGGGADDYRVWVLALVEVGDSKRATAVGSEAVEKYPDHPDLHYWLAHAFFREDRFVDALAAIDRAISIDGEPAYPCLRADILLRLGEFEAAIQEAQSVLDMEPDHWHSFEQMIDAAVGVGRFRDAEAYANRLVQLAPDEPKAMLVATGFFANHGQLDHALDLVDRALEVDASDMELCRLRGFILFRMENYGMAAEELRRSVAHHKESVSTHCWLADALLHSEEWEEAVEVAERLVEIDPTHSHAHCVRGDALIELGRAAEARAAFDELLPTSDCNSLLHAATGVRKLGDFESAAKYLRRVADLDSGNPRLWIERTLLHIDEGAFDRAASSAAALQALPGRELLGRLFAAQAAAATKPLSAVLAKLGSVLDIEDAEGDGEQHMEATVGILATSVRNFGPRHLPQGVSKLREQLSWRADEGILGRILAELLRAVVGGDFVGELTDWELALNWLSASLSDLPDCSIPIAMFRLAVRYSKTGDEKHLLSLPLEQRQLLEDNLPAMTGDRSGTEH